MVDRKHEYIDRIRAVEREFKDVRPLHRASYLTTIALAICDHYKSETHGSVLDKDEWLWVAGDVFEKVRKGIREETSN